jgi:hypothetical protein
MNQFTYNPNEFSSPSNDMLHQYNYKDDTDMNYNNMRQPNMRQPDMRQPDMRQPDMRQPDMRQPDMRQPDMRQPDMRQYDMRQYDMRQPDMIYPDQVGDNYISDNYYSSKNRYKNISNNKNFESFQDGNTGFNFMNLIKKIIVFTILFLIMSHIKMNHILCSFIPFVEKNEIACMVTKGFIMSLIIIILYPLL